MHLLVCILALLALGDAVSARPARALPTPELHATSEPEAAVLCGLLIAGREYPDALARVIDSLEPEAFFGTPDRTLYASIRRVHRAGESVDIITVADELKRAGELEAVGGYDRLSSLLDAVPSAAGMESHARLVQQAARERRIRSVLASALRSLDEPNREPLDRIVNGAVHTLERIGAAGGAPTLFDPAHHRLDRFDGVSPPHRRFLLSPYMPDEIVGALGGAGGSGKSNTLYQLAAFIASGFPGWGMEAENPGAVLLLFAEDDEGEIHRRGHALLTHLEHLPGWTQEHSRLARERVYPVSRVGADNLLTSASREGGEVHRTPLVQQLVRTAQRIPDLRLIVVDPQSRFRGGKANAEEDTSRYVETLEAIRGETGASVLSVMHVNKAGQRDGGGVETLRGSTAAPDSFRWVSQMEVMRESEAPNFGLAAEDAAYYVRLKVTKSNYTAPFPDMWLRREPGGVLVPVELEERRVEANRQRAEITYMDVLARLQSLIRERGPMSRNQVRGFATTTGPLAAGDKTVRGVIERAAREGFLIERNNLLHVPQEDA